MAKYHTHFIKDRVLTKAIEAAQRHMAEQKTVIIDPTGKSEWHVVAMTYSPQEDIHVIALEREA